MTKVEVSDKLKKNKKSDVYQINETDHFSKWMKKLNVPDIYGINCQTSGKRTSYHL